MEQDLLAGLILGSLVAAALALAALKAAKAYRKAKSTWRRWCRTRMVITQAPKKKCKTKAKARR